MVLLAAGSGLVAGSAFSNTEGTSMQTVQVEVVRAFYYEGKSQKVGARLTLPKTFAAEVVAANKAKVVAEPAADQSAGSKKPSATDK